MHASTSTSTMPSSPRCCPRYSSSSSCSRGFIPARSLAIALVAASTLSLLSSSLVVNAQGVYVPGPIDEVPGNSPAAIATGVDGYTTYIIGGATLQENSASAIMTNYDTQGLPVVYNCALGPDAQASCSVVQGNGANYAYTEPITFFGETTMQMPAAYATTAVLSATNTGVSATPTTIGATSKNENTTPAGRGPAANNPQATNTNVFGAGDVNGGAIAIAPAKGLTGALLAVGACAIAGAAMVLA